MADYLAKQELSYEMSNHNTKTARKKGLLLGQLLDKAARGDKKSSAEWLRAIEALQGRSRFHAGDIDLLPITRTSHFSKESINDPDPIPVPLIS